MRQEDQGAMVGMIRRWLDRLLGRKPKTPLADTSHTTSEAGEVPATIAEVVARDEGVVRVEIEPLIELECVAEPGAESAAGAESVRDSSGEPVAGRSSAEPAAVIEEGEPSEPGIGEAVGFGTGAEAEGETAWQAAVALQGEAPRSAAVEHGEDDAGAKSGLVDEVARTALRDLGRGVSSGLRDLSWREVELRALGLPLLRTPEDLAGALGLNLARLRWLAYHALDARVCHYHRVLIPKRSGGERALLIPQRTLAQAQRWVLREILDRIPREEAAHGFVRGRSIVTNAQPHARQHVVINMDLCDFFGTIGWRRVRRVFERLGYARAVATVLALMCTEAPRRRVELEDGVHHVATGERGLPQGACTSPALANAVVRRLDRRLGGLAKRWGAAYTRYADDLTFSGGEALNGSVGRFLGRARQIIEEEGFAIQEAKTRVMHRGGRQVVTGLVVNDRPKLDRARIRRIRAILHRARTTGLQAQDRVGGRSMRAHVRGLLAHLATTQPELAGRMRRELDALED